MRMTAEMNETLAKEQLVSSLTLRQSQMDASQLATRHYIASQQLASYEESIAVGSAALEAGSGDRGQLAYNLGCSSVRAGDVQRAFYWLDRAVDLGFADLDLLERDADLDTLRYDDRYAAVRRRLQAHA